MAQDRRPLSRELPQDFPACCPGNPRCADSRDARSRDGGLRLPHFLQALQSTRIVSVISRSIRQQRASKVIALGAKRQLLLIHATGENRAVRRPMQGSIAAAPLAVHAALDDVLHPFLLLQPLHLFEPCDYAVRCLWIERHVPDVTRTTIQAADRDLSHRRCCHFYILLAGFSLDTRRSVAPMRLVRI
jgi:hypothetical protein